jgi:hypothetical protein
MFSPQIQSYINSSSQAQAFSRVNELNRYIDSFYPKETLEANKTDVFKEILAESKAQTVKWTRLQRYSECHSAEEYSIFGSRE